SLDGKIRPIFGMTVAAAVTDVHPGGRVLFTSISGRSAMMCQAPGQSAERDLSWLRYSLASDMTPGGGTVLFNETREGALAAHRQSITYTRKTDGSPAVPLGEGRSLGISPDGQWAAVVAPANPRQLTLLPTGPGEPRLLKPEKFRYYDARWFPDGKRLL